MNSIQYSVFSILLCISIQINAQKTYQKTYFENGNLKEEGWTKNNKKIKYWYFYRNDDSKESEGHFVNGKKNKWWLFYNEAEILIRKCQFKDNQKNGYCFIYENKRIVKAEKFKAGQKIKQWTDMKSFKKENSLRDINDKN